MLCYLCKVLLKHFLLGIVVLLQNIRVIERLVAIGLLCSWVYIRELVQSSFVLHLEVVRSHSRRNILAACQGAHIVEIGLDVVGWSLVKANNLSRVVAHVVVGGLLVDWLVPLVYGYQLILDELVVWLVLVLELVYVIEDILNLIDVLRLVPQHLLWVL